jgi:hypothetical protein
MELRLLKLVFFDNCIKAILKFVDEDGKFHYYKEKSFHNIVLNNFNKLSNKMTILMYHPGGFYNYLGRSLINRNIKRSMFMNL